MVNERLYDVLENDGQPYVSGLRWGHRCVACGKISDWVIEQNWQTARKAVTVDERIKNPEAGVA